MGEASRVSLTSQVASWKVVSFKKTLAAHWPLRNSGTGRTVPLFLRGPSQEKQEVVAMLTSERFSRH